MDIDRLQKRFASPSGDLRVFENLSMKFPENTITVILGPSGCGKTTLLNILAGFMPYDGGVIRRKPKQISYLFQEPRLLPWRTVERNISLVLEHHITDRVKQNEAVHHYLELVGLQSFAGHYPHELSGGMKQRASIARAFACPSQLLLMDEPFQALDLDLRISLVNSFTRLWEEDPKTTIFVTHDIQEALMVADTVAVFSKAPAQVRGTVKISIPRSQRSLEDAELSKVERKVLSLLLSSRG